MLSVRVNTVGTPSRDHPQPLADVIWPDGSHTYWSTHCRHDRHDACSATEHAPGVPRQPARCKTCAAPCVCHCHSPEEITA